MRQPRQQSHATNGEALRSAQLIIYAASLRSGKPLCASESLNDFKQPLSTIPHTHTHTPLLAPFSIVPCFMADAPVLSRATPNRKQQHPPVYHPPPIACYQTLVTSPTAASPAKPAWQS